MPISSTSFFTQLAIPPNANLSGQADKLIQKVSNMRSNLQYKDFSRKDIDYIQNATQFNNIDFITLKNSNLNKQQKKQRYLASLLHRLHFIELQRIIHRAYLKTIEDEKLEKEAKAIQRHIRNLFNEKNATDESSESEKAKEKADLLEQFLQDSKTYFLQKAKSTLRTSTLLPLIGETHVWRIALVFVRITFQEMLVMAASWDYFNEFLKNHPNDYGGFDASVNNILQGIADSKVYFNSLSVALPALRLVLQLALFAKHCIGATDEEKKLAPGERALRDLKKRYYVLGNDIVWTIINFITNFNKLCRISANHALIITVCFMLFDMLWLIPGWIMAHQDFLEQSKILEDELKAAEPGSIEYLTINENMQRLIIQYQAKMDGNYYSFLATGLFVLGFITAVLFPASAVFAYSVCNFAMALNMLGGDFTQLREKKITLNELEFNSNLTSHKNFKNEYEILEKEYEMARNNFIATVLIYTILPTFTMMTFAVCWPAAIPLALAMIVFQTLLLPEWKAYQKEVIGDMRAEQTQRLTYEIFDESESESIPIMIQ